MDSNEIRLRIIEGLISKAPQSPDVSLLIERARVIEAYVSDNSPEPARPKGTLSIVTDKATGPRKV